MGRKEFHGYFKFVICQDLEDRAVNKKPDGSE